MDKPIPLYETVWTAVKHKSQAGVEYVKYVVGAKYKGVYKPNRKD